MSVIMPDEKTMASIWINNNFGVIAMVYQLGMSAIGVYHSSDTSGTDKYRMGSIRIDYQFGVSMIVYHRMCAIRIDNNSLAKKARANQK